ncbi:MAG TPA: PilZ domain-containing protein [Bradyrhizobium sp.]|jgi:PilZ domain|nr:PilZ domain-containing protein [Bradyrhizobium sp.]
MAYGDRKSERVDFERGIHVYIMGIDGTWRRKCMMIDVSQTGARLRIEGTVEGLDLKEFFLLLSSTGLAFRRCQLVRMDGDQIGVRFLERDRATKRSVKKQPTGEPV